MNYLVTGGAGFIGSNLVEQLLKDGHNVRVLDNFCSGKKENIAKFTGLKHFELIEGDIRDKAACEKACQGTNYILHQAALRSVPKSMEDPESYNEVNIGGTLNLLQASLKAKVKRFVFASSSSVYGDTDQFPEKEEAYPLLISPYALSKLAGEYYCRIFSSAYNLETVCLRYFNVFGPRQALDDEYAVVIPKFIHCILHDEAPPIFGTGKQSRDFTYIDNVVQANLLSATRSIDGGHGSSDAAPSRPVFIQGMHKSTTATGTDPQRGAMDLGVCPPAKHHIFNVANGRDNTVLELVEALNKIIGKNIKPKFLPVRPGDVFKTLADISKIKNKLGFVPAVKFEEGLKRTVEYWKTAGQTGR